MKYPDTELSYERIDSIKKFKEISEWLMKAFKNMEKKSHDFESAQAKFQGTVLSVHNPNFYFFIFYNENGSIGGFSVSKIVISNLNKIMVTDDVYCPNFKSSGQIMEFIYNIAMDERCDKVVLTVSRSPEAFKKLIEKKTFLKNTDTYHFMVLEEK